MPDSLNGGVRRPLTPQQELAKLMESNKAGFVQLAQMGVRAEIGDLLNVRIHTLAELLFGNGPQMLEFQLRFERKVSAILTEMTAEARKARLAANAMVPASEVQKMAKAQGLLGPDGNPIRR